MVYNSKFFVSLTCLTLHMGTSVAYADDFGDIFSNDNNELNEVEQEEVALILKLEECKKTPETEECQQFFIQYGEQLNVDLDKYILKEVIETPIEEPLEHASGVIEETVTQNTPRKITPQTSAEEFFNGTKGLLRLGYGYIYNNPMVTRFDGYVHGEMNLSKLIVGVEAGYLPDLGSNDLKELTQKFVEIANNRSNQSNFEQPVEKILLEAGVYAGIPIFYANGFNGRNIRFSTNVGIKMISSKKYYAYSDGEVISLRYTGRTTHLPVTMGLNLDVFPQGSDNGLSLSMNSRIYRAPAPIYDPNDAAQQNSYIIYTDSMFGLAYGRIF